MMMIRSLFILGGAALTVSALVTSALSASDDFSIPAEPSAKIDTDSENIFGFTEGSDTPKQGEREISVDGVGRFGKRRFGPAEEPRLTMPDWADQPLRLVDDDGVLAPAAAAAAGTTSDDRARRPGPTFYRALNAKLGYQYGLTDDLSVELGLFGDTRRVKNVPDLLNKSSSAFDGLSVELKYRLIERTRENPFGLAVQIEPRWSRVADVEGRGQNTFSLETKLLADLRIIPDRLWLSSNASWEPESGRLRGTGEGVRESTFAWSTALSLRVAERTFV